MQQIGRYRILGELGRGAMGIVYRAQDPTIGRIIAIKSIRLSEMSDETERTRLRERLFREAQSAGVLSHPHIVTIYDILEENNLAYIFMECVNGPPLDDWLRSSAPPSPAQLLKILAQTGEALDYAHKSGIIHRDIKPANIMVHDEHSAKVCDFGVAKIASQQLTQTGLLMGTPSYMSPEQLQGEKLDGRSDQFALAVMVYEFLAGQKPFTGESIPALIFRICRDDPPEIASLNPTVGPLVDTVVRKALAKRPEDRYDSCAKFIAFVQKALDGREWVIPATARAGREDSTTASGNTGLGVDDPEKTTHSGMTPVASIPPPTASPAASTGNVTGGSGSGGVDRPSAGGGGSTTGSVPVIPSPAFAAEPFRPPLGATASTPAADVTKVVLTSDSGGAPRTAAAGAELPVRRLDEVHRPAGSKSRAWLAIPLVAALGGAGYFLWTQQQDQSVGTTADPAPATTPTAPPSAPPAPAKGTVATPPPTVATPPPTAPPASPVAVDPAKPAATPTDTNPSPGGTPIVTADPNAPIVPSGSTLVQFTTAPAGASVVVDNSTETSCKAPCTIPLPKGRHTVMATLEGHIPSNRIFTVPDVSAVSITLDIDGGRVRILTNPPGASITVNGQPHNGVTPAVIPLRTGTYTIELTKDGRKHTESVTVKRDVTSTLSIDWK